MTTMPDKAAKLKANAALLAIDAECQTRGDYDYIRLMVEAVRADLAPQPGQAVDVEAGLIAGRINLFGGWYLVRDEHGATSSRKKWYLSNSDGVWVAPFWDGDGSEDAAAFAVSLGLLAPPAREASSEPVAWHHTCQYETGEKATWVTERKDHGWGTPGKDFSEELEITSVPLYAHPAPSPAPTDQDRAEALLAAIEAECQTGGKYDFIRDQVARIRALSQAAPVHASEADCLLRRIMSDLPTNRDWLDPAVERQTKAYMAAPVQPDHIREVTKMVPDALLALVKELVEARKRANDEPYIDYYNKGMKDYDLKFYRVAANIANLMAELPLNKAGGIPMPDGRLVTFSSDQDGDRVALARAIEQVRKIEKEFRHEHGRPKSYRMCIPADVENDSDFAFKLVLNAATRILGEQP